ncbi:hypothetical protein F3J14_32020 [Burkholderia sp. Tr-862]|uniref:hypothetical protein n=1 Tax=Burkholderia sp. Tr-862 TaxID=2608331 RepID=UPI001419680D|nr:hypothetical protein [Burkholderia sp. Tr-862]NIF45400.1 hypothetical protein [Burkholderia sp. Tr-862]
MDDNSALASRGESLPPHALLVIRKRRNLCDDSPLRVRRNTPLTKAPGCGPPSIVHTYMNPEARCPQ